jgi:outer membrane biosynthesis protein TonB
LDAQGVVYLKVSVGEESKIEAIEVIKSAGESPAHKMLDRTSIEQAKTCNFTGTTPVEKGPYVLEYRWSLQ